MKKEWLIAPLTTLALFELSTLAFSKASRKEIGVRDHWTCQGIDGACTCGLHGQPATYKDGFMVEAAHLDHSRSNSYYDDPDNGRILCRVHHAMEHFLRNEFWEAEEILKRGVYHWNHANKTREQLYITLDDLEVIYEREAQSLQFAAGD